MSIKRNTLWNIAGTGLPLLAGVICIPFVLARLGSEAFGVVSLIWALIGYFGLFDMGVGRALTFEISKLRIEGSATLVAETLKAGMLVTLVTGVCGAVLMFFIAPHLAHSWLKISPAWQSDAQLAFQIAAFGVIPTTITSGLRGALEGFERFATSNIIRLFFGLCMFGLPGLSLMLHGNSIGCITLYLVGARLVVVILSFMQLRSYLWTSTSLPAIKCQMSGLFCYGFWVTVSGIVGPLMIYGDRFFVGATVGADQLPFYSIPQEGLQRLLIIPGALCGALLPRITSLAGKPLIGMYTLNYRRITVVMFCICVVTVVLAHPILSWWLSSDFADKALPVVLVLTLGIWINSIAQLPYTVLHALGQPRVTAIFHLLELVFYFIVLYWLTSEFGLLGAAVAWLARVFLDLMLLQTATSQLLKRNY